jgi:hypothetical protein
MNLFHLKNDLTSRDLHKYIQLLNLKQRILR